MNHLPVFKAWVRSLTCVPAAYCAFLHASRSAVTVTRLISFDCRLPRCPSSRVSSTGPAESAWAQGIHIVAGVSCIICEYPLTLIGSLFYRWRGKKKSNIALRSQPQRKTPLSQISLSFRKRQTVSGEMKGLRGEDVVCSQASMWCLVLDANIKFESLNVVKPTFYFLFLYLICMIWAF